MNGGRSYKRVEQTSSDVGLEAHLLGCDAPGYVAFAAAELAGSVAVPYAYISTIAGPVYRTEIAEALEPDLTDLLMRAAERSFAEVWDSPEDDVWDTI